MNRILVTGGAGYIGSFIVRALKTAGYEPYVVDDFSSGHEEAIVGFSFKKLNLSNDSDLLELEEWFKKERFDGVIHMASFIQMGESFRDPYKYFRNNINSANNILGIMARQGAKNFVFSSSAGVYGSPKKLPISEDDPKIPENPYGQTKLMIEEMLPWYERAHKISHVSIRYFNAAGAALDGSIGEDHPNESHIIPLIMKAAMEGGEFTLFGDDYNTPDGTCVRDYIHVLDLADAHIKALTYLEKGGESTAVNAGLGRGYSNLELIREIEKVAGNLAWKFGPRRPGDADILYADNKKIKELFGWEPKYGLAEIIDSAWKWHKNNPKGYS